MENIWAFLLQTLTVSMVAALILFLKWLFQDKLSPRWQYGVWIILLLRMILPKQMDSEEVANAVQAIVEQAGVELTVKNKGQVMKAVMAELKGKADGKLIGTVVDSLLSE